MEAAYRRIATCELCGQKFTVTCKTSRPKRCPECTTAITGRRTKGMINVKGKRNVSKLDTTLKEAKKYGLSYGKYVGLKKAGYKLKAQKTNTNIIHHEDDWIASLYATVAACKKRTTRRRK